MTSLRAPRRSARATIVRWSLLSNTRNTSTPALIAAAWIPSRTRHRRIVLSRDPDTTNSQSFDRVQHHTCHSHHRKFFSRKPTDLLKNLIQHNCYKAQQVSPQFNGTVPGPFRQTCRHWYLSRGSYHLPFPVFTPTPLPASSLPSLSHPFPSISFPCPIPCPNCS